MAFIERKEIKKAERLLQEAKNNFSEIVKRAFMDGPKKLHLIGILQLY